MYIEELIELYRSISPLRPSSATLTLKPVRSRTRSYGDRRFSVAAPVIWNELPYKLRATYSLHEFKRKLSPAKVGMSVIAKKRMSCKKTKIKQLTVIANIVG